MFPAATERGGAGEAVAGPGHGEGGRDPEAAGAGGAGDGVCATEGEGDKVVVNDNLDDAYRELEEWVVDGGRYGSRE